VTNVICTTIVTTTHVTQ